MPAEEDVKRRGRRDLKEGGENGYGYKTPPKKRERDRGEMRVNEKRDEKTVMMKRIKEGKRAGNHEGKEEEKRGNEAEDRKMERRDERWRKRKRRWRDQQMYSSRC